MTWFHPLVQRLNEQTIAYIIVGGVAGMDFRICSLRHLIELKQRAGRAIDLDDIRRLKWNFDEPSSA